MRGSAESLKERSEQFALCVIRLCRCLARGSEGAINGRQLMRSATSVAANYRAVCRARSTPDFVSQLAIALEESDESLFSMALLGHAGIASPDKTRVLKAESG
jgi:four helix bundle protein